MRVHVIWEGWTGRGRGRGCHKTQYFCEGQSEPHFLMPGQSEVMHGGVATPL